MRINDLLALQHVPRWTIVSHSRPQSVAEHTFGVMVIALELANRLGSDLSRTALLYALHHDGPESLTGDIPATAKRRIQDTWDFAIDPLFDADGIVDAMSVNMTPTERAIISLADKLEGMVYINKYGIGPHAKKVAELCGKEINEMAEKEGHIVHDVVTKLAAELVWEHGR